MSDGIETPLGTIRPAHYYPSGVRHRIITGPKFLYAMFNPADEMHTVSTALPEFIKQQNKLPYNRLVVNDHIIDEAATRLKKKVSLRNAVTFLETVRDSQYFVFESTPASAFTHATERFSEWDELDASMTDFIIASHMEELGIDYIATYDSDFGAFDVTTVPYIE